MGQTSNINIRHRLTQVVILVIVIVACMLFSQVAKAQKPGNKYAMDKPKYRVPVHKSAHKTCYILFKKRNCKPSHGMFASNRKKRQSAEMAETDAPARIAGAN